MFDKKFLIVELWSFSMDVRKIYVEKILIWVKFSDFNIKYWGLVSLFKIAGIMSMMVKVDRVIIERELLSFMRVMVEVLMK